MLTLGHDLKTREPVLLEADHARVLLICGKRGSGKSYTLGVLAEELFQQDPRPCVVIADPVGIFWTMSQPSEPSGRGLPVRLLVPGEPATAYPAPLLEHFQQLGIAVERITLRPSELSPDAWCELFNFSINEPLGIAMARAAQSSLDSLRSLGITPSKPRLPAGRVEGSLADVATGFDLGDLEEAVQHDPLSQDRTKEALLNRLSMAKRWRLFEAQSPDLMQRLTPEALGVLDLSVLDYSTHGLRSLVLAMVARNLFTAAHAARQRAVVTAAPRAPLWLLIDEAHQFIPHGASTLAKDTLIRWVKEGRQPGLSCILASQQPGSLEQDVLSQCDALVAHKLTNLEDLHAANRLSQAYMGSELKVYLRHLKHPGQAVLVDDARERVAMLQVRSRRTRHGGGEW